MGLSVDEWNVYTADFTHDVGNPQVGTLMDVADRGGVFYPAVVIQSEPDKFKVHFCCWHPQFNQWIKRSEQPRRCLPLGRRSKWVCLAARANCLSTCEMLNQMCEFRLCPRDTTAEAAGFSQHRQLPLPNPHNTCYLKQGFQNTVDLLIVQREDHEHVLACTSRRADRQYEVQKLGEDTLRIVLKDTNQVQLTVTGALR